MRQLTTRRTREKKNTCERAHSNTLPPMHTVLRYSLAPDLLAVQQDAAAATEKLSYRSSVNAPTRVNVKPNHTESSRPEKSFRVKGA